MEAPKEKIYRLPVHLVLVRLTKGGSQILFPTGPTTPKEFGLNGNIKYL